MITVKSKYKRESKLKIATVKLPSVPVYNELIELCTNNTCINKTDSQIIYCMKPCALLKRNERQLTLFKGSNEVK